MTNNIKVKWLVDLNTDINQVQESTVEQKLFQYELFFTSENENNSGDNLPKILEDSDSETDITLILDRNLVFHAKFREHLEKLLQLLQHLNNWDAVYLGFKNQDISADVPFSFGPCQINENPIAYLVSAGGAKKIAESKSFANLNAFKINPLLATSRSPSPETPQNKENQDSEREAIRKQVLTQLPNDVPETVVEQLVDNVIAQKKNTVTEPEPETNERDSIRKQVIEQLPDDVPENVVEQLVDNIITQRKEQAESKVATEPKVRTEPKIGTEPKVDTDRESIRQQIMKQVPEGTPDSVIDQLINNIISQRKPKERKNKLDSTSEKSEPKPLRCKVECVNLKRRPDRKLQFIQEMANAEFDNYSFFEAVDGTKIEKTPEIEKMFEGNNFNWRQGVIGCAMSHTNLWNQLVKDDDADVYLVFEDDAKLDTDFKQKITEILKTMSSSRKSDNSWSWDIIWLGYHMWKNDLDANAHIYRSSLSSSSSQNIRVQPLCKKLTVGGTFAYLINKQCAMKYLNYIKHNGLKYAIDEFMVGQVNRRPLNLDLEIIQYEVVPHLVTSDWLEPGQNRNIDSDIQKYNRPITNPDSNPDSNPGPNKSDRNSIRKQVLEQVPSETPDSVIDQLVENIISQRNSQNGEQKQPVTGPIEKNIRCKVECINLERCADKKLDFIQEMATAQFDAYSFFEGVDGDTIQKTPLIEKLFNSNRWSTDDIGQAMSHTKLWNKLVSDDSSDLYMIFEDEAKLSDQFTQKITAILQGLGQSRRPDDSWTWDVTWLGYNSTKNSDEPVTNQIRIQPLETAYFNGGMFAYLINKQGALKFINHIKQNGYGNKNNIAEFMTEWGNETSHIEVSPQIVSGPTIKNIEASIEKMVDDDLPDLVPMNADEANTDPPLEQISKVKDDVTDDEANTDEANENLPAHWVEGLVTYNLSEMGPAENELTASASASANQSNRSKNKKKNRTKKKKKTVCLNMIVKNEGHVIEEVLECMSKYIDYYVICDTGSTDDTEKKITEFMNKKKIPGEIHHHKWRDFGYNRTRALQACVGKSDYIWIIDADDLVVGNLVLPDLKADGYQLQYGTSYKYERTQIVKNDLDPNNLIYGWEYRGVLHEYIRPKSGKKPLYRRIGGNYHIESRRLGDRNKVKDKYLRDAKVFEKAILEEKDEKLVTRYYFYLAQSYRDANMAQEAIKNYQIRADRGGWDEEVAYSLLQAALQMLKLTSKNGDETGIYTHDQVCSKLLEAYKAQPTRAEALCQIARIKELDKNWTMAYVYYKKAANLAYPANDQLFVDKPIYDYKALVGMMNCAYKSAFNEAGAGAGRTNLEDAEWAAKKLIQRIDDQLVKNTVERDLIQENIEKVRTAYKMDEYQGDLKESKGKMSIYTPSSKKVMCIYAGYSSVCEPNASAEMSRRHETSEHSIRMFAEQFTEEYDVFVFQNVGPVVKRNGVTYLHVNLLNQLLETDKFNVHIMIVARYLNYFSMIKHRAEKLYLWAHDTILPSFLNGVEMPEQGRFLLANVWHLVDGIICGSDWQMHNIATVYKFTPEQKQKMQIIGNGIPEEILLKIGSKVSPPNKRIVYTGDQSRGLDKVLEVFPLLANDAELHIYTKIKEEQRVAIAGESRIHLHEETMDVVSLAEEMSKSTFWLYPTDFPETCCTALLMALAVNLVPVTTQFASLEEMLKDGQGVLLDESLDKNEVADTMNDLLVDHEKIADCRRLGKRYVRDYIWSDIKRKWQTECDL